METFHPTRTPSVLLARRLMPLPPGRASASIRPAPAVQWEEQVPMTITSGFDRWSSSAGDGGFAIREHHVLSSSVDVCVLTVQGEMDLVTVPLIDAAVRTVLAAGSAIAHLVVDVAEVRFVSCAGLRWLLDAPDLGRLTGSRLHLSGLSNRVVARPLELITLSDLLQARSTAGIPVHVHPDLARALDALAA